MARVALGAMPCHAMPCTATSSCATVHKHKPGPFPALFSPNRRQKNLLCHRLVGGGASQDDMFVHLTVTAHGVSLPTATRRSAWGANFDHASDPRCH